MTGQEYSAGGAWYGLGGDTFAFLPHRVAQLTGRGGAWYVPVSAFPTSEANYRRVSEKRARSSKLACPVPMVLLQKTFLYTPNKLMRDNMRANLSELDRAHGIVMLHVP